MLKGFFDEHREMLTVLMSFYAAFYIVIVYPFQHLYFFHLSYGNIAPFMGGFFAHLNLLTIMILFGYSLMRYKEVITKPVGFFILIFLAFIMVCTLVVLYNLRYGVNGVNSPELFTYNAKVLINYVALFFAGYYYKHGILKNFILGTLFLVLLNYLLFTGWQVIQFNYIFTPGMYQSLSRTALVTILFSWTLPKNNKLSIILIIMGAFTLYGIGSRPDFWLYIFLSPLLVWFLFRGQIEFNNKKILFFGLIIITFLAFIILNGSSRMAAILNPYGDGSFQVRMNQFAFGFKQISNNPVLGDYGGAFVHFNGQGHYMHNFFSIWQDFGLIPFVLFISLCVFVLYYSYLFIKNKQVLQNRNIQMVVVFCIMAVLQVMLARSFGWPEIALAWGLMCGLLHKEKSWLHNEV